MIKNKKSQYIAVSPILVIGIVLFCVPTILNVFNINLDIFFKNIFTFSGIFLILIGAGFSMNKANKMRGY